MLLRGMLCLSLAMGLLGCGDDGGAGTEPDASGDELLDPPAPGEGVQFQMITQIPAGAEVEHCRFVRAPAEALFVNRDEVRFTSGSHHVLLYETAYDDIPSQKEDGTAVDTSGVFDCSDGATNGWRINRLVGGSQNSDGDSLLSFPDGVAMKVRAGAVLLLNAHYINATDATIEPEVRINLYTIPEADVQTEGGILFLYNPLIHVPANGTGRARWRCPVYGDISVANMQSHMHSRGVGFAANVAGGEPVYETDRWEGVPVAQFTPELQVAAGSYLDYYCDYANAEGRDVYQGARTTDEMCMLIGSYYPADPRTSNCLDATGSTLAGEWVGNGTATCAQTWTCMQAAFGQQPVLAGLTECMVAADPAVSKESSDVMNCLIATGNPGQCGDPIAACEAK